MIIRTLTIAIGWWILLLTSQAQQLTDIPPSARTYIVEQTTVPSEKYKETRHHYETWLGCTHIIDINIEQNYHHLVCTRTIVTEGQP